MDDLSLETPEKEEQMGEILVYQAGNGKIKVDVRLQDETVWLTQQLIGGVVSDHGSQFQHAYSQYL